jgi:hypothetical protein
MVELRRPIYSALSAPPVLTHHCAPEAPIAAYVMRLAVRSCPPVRPSGGKPTSGDRHVHQPSATILVQLLSPERIVVSFEHSVPVVRVGGKAGVWI